MDKKKKLISIKDLCDIALVASLYTVLTVALAPISYGNFQFRVAEILILLCFYNRKYGISLILGCFIANCFSPLGWPDIVFGTLSTVIPVVLICFSKHLIVASLWAPIFVGIIVGLEVAIIYELPIWMTILEVFVGEFVVVTIVGYPVFKLLELNKILMKIIDAKRTSKGKLVIEEISHDDCKQEENNKDEI